ncbi:callose synthase 5 [Euphorbia peplus]|nr:callose synthase 5 [Euphorbia peplus]
MSVFDNEVVPSSLSSIAPILRIADEIEYESPRVAYLCRFYAFELAKRSGPGEGMLKKNFLLRLERDHVSSLPSRFEKTDAREMESFHQQYYEQYVQSLDYGDYADRDQLGKAYQTAGVLFEVLCFVYKIQEVEVVPPKIIAAARDVQEKLESYAPYNILPLVSARASKSIMQLEEETAAVGVVVTSSLSSILPILHIANAIEHERPRVAYLCRFYAIKKAHRLDESFIGRRVRQFKMSALQRLERENASSLPSRIKNTDAEEIDSFYRQYYEQYVRLLDQGDQGDLEDWVQLGKAHQTAGVLFEVLCAVNKTEKVEKAILAARDIHPLDSAEASQSILTLEEARPLDIFIFLHVKASVGALLCNTRGLAWPTASERHRQQAGDLDIFDWLQAMFGFQRANVRNQREYLISRLADNHKRLCLKPGPLHQLDERAVAAFMHKLFMKYKEWCAHLGQKHSLCLPQGLPEIQQREILYMGLYLLVRGEAANVRDIPQCLYYIFHNMACELDVLLAANVSIAVKENIKSSYGCDDEAFLRKVITPIYLVVKKEAWNYDNLNAYFGSTDCFSLGWPIRDRWFSRGCRRWLSQIFAIFKS